MFLAVCVVWSEFAKLFIRHVFVCGARCPKAIKIKGSHGKFTVPEHFGSGDKAAVDGLKTMHLWLKPARKESL